MKIFDYSDYKAFLKMKLEQSPHKGHGVGTRIAKHLNIHTSMVSQVMSGDKHFTVEQACDLCTYFGFTEIETDYFLALVQRARAGTPESLKKFDRDLAKIKSLSENLKHRLSKDIVLTEADNAIFYSQWFYTAIKLLCSIQGLESREALSAKLGIPIPLINKAAEFLLSVGLCIEKDGKIKPGPANTHLDADSPMIGRHHQNWRIKGFEKMGTLKPTELFLTMPATLSAKDVILLRTKIVEFIEEFVKTIDSSKGEVLYCLNIDWFNI